MGLSSCPLGLGRPYLGYGHDRKQFYRYLSRATLMMSHLAIGTTIGIAVTIIELALFIWLWRAVGSYIKMLHAWHRGDSYAKPKFFRWIFGLPNPWDYDT